MKPDVSVQARVARDAGARVRPGAVTDAPVGRDRRRRRALVLLAVAAVVSVAGYMLVDVQGSWPYALALRARRVAAMILVGYAVALSTLLFQTVTNNRILSPSIMGFDSLYLLIQTVSIWFFGTLALLRMPVSLRFATEVGLMLGFAGVLYRGLFARGMRNLYVLVLAGIICGTLFGSVTSLVSRLLDPNEFLTLQDRMFASFGSVDDQLLVAAALVVVAVTVLGWPAARYLDVIALGRDHSVNLGVDHAATVRRLLAAVTVLVSVSTALVGPITFLGLLVANLGRQMVGTFRHPWTVPAATLLGVVALIGGQLVLEHVFGYDTALSVIVNFVGGAYFLFLLLREAQR